MKIIKGAEKTHVEWTVRKMAEMAREGELNFDLDIQRGYVWKDKERCSALIRTLILDRHLPPLYFNKTERYDCEDGKQRCTTIVRYMDDMFVLEGLEEFTVIDDNGDTAEMDINGLKFSELPECFQNAIKEFNLTVCLTDNASQDEVADTFYNLNNGQALNTATLNRVKAKSLDKIVELGNHTLFTEALSQIALNGHVNEDLVAKAHAMLYDHEPSMETKYIRPYMKDTEFTEEHVNTLRNVFDYIKKIHDGIENKKIAKRIYSRTHLISIVPMINRAIEERKDEYKVTKWIESFYNGSRSATISKSYNDAAGSGSAKKESVRKRMNELEKNYNMFFKDDEEKLNPVINPKKKSKTDKVEESMVSEMENNTEIENEVDENTNEVA